MLYAGFSHAKTDLIFQNALEVVTRLKKCYASLRLPKIWGLFAILSSFRQQWYPQMQEYKDLKKNCQTNITLKGSYLELISQESP